jgi:hypothetical protein
MASLFWRSMAMFMEAKISGGQASTTVGVGENPPPKRRVMAKAIAALFRHLSGTSAASFKDHFGLQPR